MIFKEINTVEQWLKVYSNFMRITLISSISYTYFFGSVATFFYCWLTLMSLIVTFIFYDRIREEKDILLFIHNNSIHTHLFTLWMFALMVMTLFISDIKNILIEKTQGLSIENSIYFIAYMFFLIIDYQLARLIQKIINKE